MPEFIMPTGDEVGPFTRLPNFVRGYFEAMFFTNTGSRDNGDMEDATFSDISQTLRVASIADCELFQEQAQALLERAYSEGTYDEEQAGRDFWFTRCGHGVGYWDRDALANEVADGLVELAHTWGDVDIYRGDDGLIY